MDANNKQVNLFKWQDPFLLEQQLSSAEIDIRNKARKYAQEKLAPRIKIAFHEENFPLAIMQEMGGEGFLGANIIGFGCLGLNAVAYGLIAREIEKVDSAFRSALSIQSSLVMHAIHSFGSPAQCDAYLPVLAAGKIIGCFGLTEPNHGSDPQSMETISRKVNHGFTLNGHKKWIGLAPVADLLVIWAKNETGRIRGYLLKKNTPGVTINEISGKLSLKAASVGEIILENVFIPEDQELPQADGLAAPLSCLDNARYGIAWGALGAAEFCWHTARNYVMAREQFGKPLAANQLIQLKLANMQTQISLGLQACLQAGRLKDQNLAATPLISLIKRNSSLVALDVARNARDMLGANGILEDYAIMRHLMNLETVVTYEGTQDIHALILGHAQTGWSSFR